MIVNNVSLEAVAVRPAQYPPADVPEVAFAGRSNVGKSSLINCMVCRKALARTSGAPGKTRTINFYNVEGVVRFVDLPGYGYARASRSEIEKWGAMIEGYLRGRESLRGVIHLVDARHEPSANDKLMAEWLAHYHHTAITVATKCDKIPSAKLPGHLRTIRAGLNLPAGASLLPFSSEKRTGRDELWAAIESITLGGGCEQ